MLLLHARYYLCSISTFGYHENDNNFFEFKNFWWTKYPETGTPTIYYS